jgi:hypothetical protein
MQATQTLESFIAEHGITATVRPAADNPNMRDEWSRTAQPQPPRPRVTAASSNPAAHRRGFHPMEDTDHDKRSDALDADDQLLMVEIIDALLALHDSGAIPVDLKPETRLGIKNLRAKIRAAL